MKLGNVILGLVVTVVVSIFVGFLWFKLSAQDSQNKMARIKIEHNETDYKVSYYDLGMKEDFIVNGGKVTTRGNYYFFWSDCTDKKGKKTTCYTQVPVVKTIIQEIK